MSKKLGLYYLSKHFLNYLSSYFTRIFLQNPWPHPKNIFSPKEKIWRNWALRLFGEEKFQISNSSTFQTSKYQKNAGLKLFNNTKYEISKIWS